MNSSQLFSVRNDLILLTRSCSRRLQQRLSPISSQVNLLLFYSLHCVALLSIGSIFNGNLIFYSFVRHMQSPLRKTSELLLNKHIVLSSLRSSFSALIGQMGGMSCRTCLKVKDRSSLVYICSKLRQICWIIVIHMWCIKIAFSGLYVLWLDESALRSVFLAFPRR